MSLSSDVVDRVGRDWDHRSNSSPSMESRRRDELEAPSMRQRLQHVEQVVEPRRSAR
jgi:hypothetical protein